jgi:leucyl aminopeptidase
MTWGEETGDLTWMMPCNEYYDYIYENPNADIGNIHSRKGGGSIKGAKFVQYFAGKKIPFAHFDIAGVADGIERLGSTNHPTGWGIKLIEKLMNNYSDDLKNESH